MRLGAGEGDERESLKVHIGDASCLSTHLQNRQAFIFVVWFLGFKNQNVIRKCLTELWANLYIFWRSLLDTFHSTRLLCNLPALVSKTAVKSWKAFGRDPAKLVDSFFVNSLDWCTYRSKKIVSPATWGVSAYHCQRSLALSRAVSSHPSFLQLKGTWKTSSNHSKTYNSVSIQAPQTWAMARGETRIDTRQNNSAVPRHVSSVGPTVHHPAPLAIQLPTGFGKAS